MFFEHQQMSEDSDPRELFPLPPFLPWRVFGVASTVAFFNDAATEVLPVVDTVRTVSLRSRNVTEYTLARICTLNRVTGLDFEDIDIRDLVAAPQWA